jgi:hypothetical protein
LQVQKIENKHFRNWLSFHPAWLPEDGCEW